MYNVEVIRSRLRARAREGGGVPVTDPLMSQRPNPTPTEMVRVIRETLAEMEADRHGAVMWIGRRVNAYADGPGREWPIRVVDYAAALDWKRRRA